MKILITDSWFKNKIQKWDIYNLVLSDLQWQIVIKVQAFFILN